MLERWTESWSGYRDRSSETSLVENSDVLVCTSEKLDSMLRSKPSLLDDIGIVVADEFHLMQDPSRGPTLRFYCPE